jgi:C4-type Zn-finger protein
MQNRVPSPTEVRSRIVSATPDCPLCKTGMRLVQATPVLFAHDLKEVVYVCDECGQRTKRTLKRL